MLLALALDLPWSSSHAVSQVDDVLAQVQRGVEVLSIATEQPPKVLPLLAQTKDLLAGFYWGMRNMSDCTPGDTTSFFLYLNQAMAKVLDIDPGMPIPFGEILPECGAFAKHLKTGGIEEAKVEFEVCVHSAMRMSTPCAHSLWKPVFGIWADCKVSDELPMCIKECGHNSTQQCIEERRACRDMNHCVKQKLVHSNPFPDPNNQTNTTPDVENNHTIPGLPVWFVRKQVG